jgi:DNA-binding response OmpR family regulator
MRSNEPFEECYIVLDDAGRVEQRRQRRRHYQFDDDVVDPWSYFAKRGRGTIRLTLIEYRILRFLAARPNQAFTHSRIADAVSTANYRVTPDALARHIHLLRGQLGFYSDTIQAVPYIGYRFNG